MPLPGSDLSRNHQQNPGIIKGSRLRPISAVEGAVMHCFGDVGGLDLGRVFEIGDSPADLENAIVSPRGKAKAIHRALEHRLAFTIDAAKTANQSRRHCRIREKSFRSEAFALTFASIDNSAANRV